MIGDVNNGVHLLRYSTNHRQMFGFDIDFERSRHDASIVVDDDRSSDDRRKSQKVPPIQIKIYASPGLLAMTRRGSIEARRKLRFF
jgi:hypothetical protein